MLAPIPDALDRFLDQHWVGVGVAQFALLECEKQLRLAFSRRPVEAG